MSETLKPPYLKKTGQRGQISIWIVDGTYVRTHIDKEFTNYGQHYNFEYIPKDEFWIDKEGKPDELNFFVDHLLIEHRLMAKGIPYGNALDVADKAEMAERKKSGDIEKLTRGTSLPDAKKVHVRLWKKLETPVSVWIVDGRLVRSVFDVDFTEGGHDYVYEFVPENEVWIDNDLDEAHNCGCTEHGKGTLSKARKVAQQKPDVVNSNSTDHCHESKLPRGSHLQPASFEQKGERRG